MAPTEVTIIDGNISCSDECNSGSEYKDNSSDESSDSSELNNKSRKKENEESRQMETKHYKRKTRTEEEHSTKSGRIIKKRVMKEGCEKNCKTKLDQEKRKSIFNKFWEIAFYNRQSAFVGCCVKRVPKKRIKVKNKNSPSRKKSSLWYSLPVQSIERVEVCTVTPDKRGTHSNRPFQILLEVKGIREHINLLPKIPSHYCRERTSKMYLEDGLNVSKMYRLYTDWAQQKNITIATERQYRDVLNSEFNIGFFKPKKDRCERCVEFELKTEKTVEFIKSYEKHLERKKNC
ncbi:hypothetical protein NQ314_015381 [Rhamnusium bicolor]|uniref:Uncharacterized protein n=1 Tax=Rhamnusium bicolor TaxID=1586634 RepID=A0AAV8WZJ9_9CUCU|nr:hypothetical protein NQ314_015381 [Rhamnusium bicolor]